MEVDMLPLIGGLISGGASLLGSIFSSNTSAQNTQAQIAASEEQQQTQNEFQQQMSNTAYQRASADMKAAGLNPMMMFGSGSAASAPSGSTIQAPMPQTTSAMAGLGGAVNQAVSSAINVKTFDKLTEEIANLQAEQARTAAQTRTESVRPAEVAANVGLKEAETRTAIERLPSATVEGTTARDILNMPSWLRSSAVQGGFLGRKLEEGTSALSNVTPTGRLFKDLWKDRVDRGY